MRGHREEPGWPDLGNVIEHLAAVRAAGDVHAADDREIVMSVALGDVGVRQPRDDMRSGLQRRHVVEQAGGVREEAAVRDLDALRRPGGTRCVDERQEVLGLDRRGSGLDVEGGIGFREVVDVQDADVGGAVDHDHRAQPGKVLARRQYAREELLFGDHHARARVADDVLDLIRRARLVDGEGRGSGHQDCEVADVELGPVGEHDRDDVAPLYPDARKTSGQRVDPLASLAPGDGDLVVARPERDLVRPLRRSHPECLCDCRGVDGSGGDGLSSDSHGVDSRWAGAGVVLPALSIGCGHLQVQLRLDRR